MIGHFQGKDKERENIDGPFAPETPGPCVCGGRESARDPGAPQTIASDDMLFFSVTSALPFSSSPSSPEEERLRYVSAFAAPSGEGTFLFLERSDGFGRGKARKTAQALVKENLFPRLVRLVKDHDLAKGNGVHSTPHGLPENFGGSVDIRYAGGEKIDYSDNQSPVISLKAGKEIAKVFSNALKGEKVPLPDVSGLVGIEFSETREGGGYTKASLSILPDGSGIDKKTAKYDGPEVFTGEKPVSPETLALIRETIVRCGLFAWAGLPEEDFFFGGEKELTFVFADRKKIAVGGNKRLPPQIGNGFFEIELEMTVKH